MDIQTKFSDKVKDLEASAIREIFKLVDKPGIISFAGGAPDPELFPCEALAEAAYNVLKNQGKVALQYGVTEGYTPLRNWVKAVSYTHLDVYKRQPLPQRMWQRR